MESPSSKDYEPIYHIEEYIEDLEGYHDKGFHPVYIGDEYADGRYQIIHKLGHGSFSTVWLARDEQTNRYVALKIIRAGELEISSESRVHQHLDKFIHFKSKGSSFVSSLLDEFYIDGVNGRHLCLVSEPAGCSVGVSKEETPFKFSKPIARAIAAQSILGLEYLHNNGVVHGGKWP